jgi:hypothetical protein
MKTIKYNNKEYKMPFDVELPEDPTAEVEVKNRFGERVQLSQSLRQLSTILSLALKCLGTMIQYVRDLIGSDNTSQNNTWFC